MKKSNRISYYIALFLIFSMMINTTGIAFEAHQFLAPASTGSTGSQIEQRNETLLAAIKKRYRSLSIPTLSMILALLGCGGDKNVVGVVDDGGVDTVKVDTGGTGGIDTGKVDTGGTGGTSTGGDTLVLNVPTVSQFTDAQRVKGLQLRGTRRLSASDPVEGFESHFRRVSASGEPLADDEGLNNETDVNYAFVTLFGDGFVLRYKLERGKEDSKEAGRFYEDNLVTVELIDDDLAYSLNSSSYSILTGGVVFQPAYASEWFSQLGFNAPAVADALLYNGTGPQFFVPKTHASYAQLIGERPAALEILEIKLDHENNRMEITKFNFVKAPLRKEARVEAPSKATDIQFQLGFSPKSV